MKKTTRRRTSKRRRMSARSVASALRRRGLMSGRKVRSAMRRRRKNPNFVRGKSVKVGDRIVARGVWFPTYKNKPATVVRVTPTAFYIVWDHRNKEQGYPLKFSMSDQYFEKIGGR